MNESLTILLPVHNAEQTLAQTTSAVLEIAAELTPRLEVAIIDDGSTDATEETACDLALRYPQVLVVRHHRPLGLEEAIQSGMTITNGSVIIVQPQGERVRAAEIRRLWELGMECRDGAKVEVESSEQANVLARLMKFGRHLKQIEAECRPGLSMFRRERYPMRRPSKGFQPNRLDKQAPTLPASPNFLTRLKDLAFGE